MPVPNEVGGPVSGQENQDLVAAPQPAEAIPTLLPHHAALLAASGISPNVVQARGYYTANTREDLASLNFSLQCPPPALIIPIRDLDGQICLHQARPDNPRQNKAGNLAKYELPKESKRMMDAPLGVRDGLLDAATTLFITIGVRQADAAVSKGLNCLAILDVWGWMKQEPFWDRLPLEGREVFIVFDSEICTNLTKQASAFRLKEFLKARLARVKFIILPGDDTGNNIALDDYLALGKSVEDLLRWATPELPFTIVKSIGAGLPRSRS